MRQSFSVDPDIMERIDKYSKSRGIKRDDAILELVEAGINFTEGGGEIKIENKRSYEEYYRIRKDLENLQRMMQDMKNQMRDFQSMIETQNKEIKATIPDRKDKPKKKGFF